MIDHLIQRILVSLGKTLGNGLSRTLEVRFIIGGWSIAQNAVQAAVTSFDEVTELVVCEEKGPQVGSGVGLKPSFSRKLMVLWCSFMKAAPRTTA